MQGYFPLHDVTVNTPNISEYLDFGFYDNISYKDNARLEMTAIERWFGVSHRVGKLVLY